MNPLADVTVGLEGTAETTVTRELTVAHHHPSMPPVYSTPSMIHLMETAAARAMQPVLPEGWVSVGAEVHVRHLAPTLQGMTVTATARVVDVGEKTVTFEVNARDGQRLVGTGTHVRAPIDLTRFTRRA